MTDEEIFAKVEEWRRENAPLLEAIRIASEARAVYLRALDAMRPPVRLWTSNRSQPLRTWRQ